MSLTSQGLASLLSYNNKICVNQCNLWEKRIIHLWEFKIKNNLWENRIISVSLLKPSE